MKKAVLIIPLFTSFLSIGQTDYTLSRSTNFINGVYIFVMCVPTNEYDFVGTYKNFDIFEADHKEIEKALKKARKKNPSFDGMIFRRHSKQVDLIKFKDRIEVLGGFKVGEEVVFVHLGKKYEGTIFFLNDKNKKKKAIIDYIDEEGESQKIKVPLKNVNRK